MPTKKELLEEDVKSEVEENASDNNIENHEEVESEHKTIFTNVDLDIENQNNKINIIIDDEELNDEKKDDKKKKERVVDMSQVLPNSPEFSDFYAQNMHFFTPAQKSMFDNLPKDNEGRYMFNKKAVKYFNDIMRKSLKLPESDVVELINSEPASIEQNLLLKIKNYNVALQANVTRLSAPIENLSFSNKVDYLNTYSVAKRTHDARVKPRWWEFFYRNRYNKEAALIEEMKNALSVKGISQAEMDESIIKNASFVVAETEIIKDGPAFLNIQEVQLSPEEELEKKEKDRIKKESQKEEYLKEVKENVISNLQTKYNFDLQKIKENSIIPLDSKEKVAFLNEHDFRLNTNEAPFRVIKEEAKEIIINSVAENTVNNVAENTVYDVEKNEMPLFEEDLLDNSIDNKSDYTDIGFDFNFKNPNEEKMDIPLETTRPFVFGLDFELIPRGASSVAENISVMSGKTELYGIEKHINDVMKEIDLEDLSISNFEDYINKKVENIVAKDYDAFTDIDGNELNLIADDFGIYKKDDIIIDEEELDFENEKVSDEIRKKIEDDLEVKL